MKELNLRIVYNLFATSHGEEKTLSEYQVESLLGGAGKINDEKNSVRHRFTKVLSICGAPKSLNWGRRGLVSRRVYSREGRKATENLGIFLLGRKLKGIRSEISFVNHRGELYLVRQLSNPGRSRSMKATRNTLIILLSLVLSVPVFAKGSHRGRSSAPHSSHAS